ncbi:MAG: RdgB/HAM1 family non-canonical purine NTP pyrophosphatase [Tissierellia bacterium]|nr:RdgB/HAM1 family non-canonical purine NTP pyrophosphatase [Tissierellia bacterium]
MIIIASHNEGKIKEMKEILRDIDDEIVGLHQLEMEDEIEENGNSLQENAAIKAQYVRKRVKSGVIVADDTGLFVEALGGAPGIYSARYAGERATDKDNRRKIQEELSGKTNRKAYFKTVICCIDEKGKEQYVEGRLDGILLTEDRGENGFGYDKIFQPLGENRSLAEMSDEEKNKISHRRRALEALKEVLT